MLKMWLRYLLAGLFLLSPLAAAVGQSPPAMVGTWTGKLAQSDGAQNDGSSGYSVVMTISANAAVTDYPELKCSGKLKRVGTADGYVFFTETITRGGKSSGGGCTNGTITVALASDKLIWAWVGADNGKTLVAWSTLVRK